MTTERDEALRLAKEAGFDGSDRFDAYDAVLLMELIRLARQPDPEVVRDAARYRWLRDNFTSSMPSVTATWTLRLPNECATTLEEDVDSAIDAKLAELEKEGK